jgi:hypothetical protein
MGLRNGDEEVEDACLCAQKTPPHKGGLKQKASASRGEDTYIILCISWGEARGMLSGTSLQSERAHNAAINARELAYLQWLNGNHSVNR